MALLSPAFGEDPPRRPVRQEAAPRPVQLRTTVVVTASRSEEELQKSPAAVVTGGELELRNTSLVD